MNAENLREAECRGTAYLAAADREGVAQTARLFLYCILGMDSMDYILARERELPAEAARHYAAILEQQAEGAPLRHLTRVQNFCGFELCVDKHVLIPRYDTGCLVEAVLWGRREGRLLDPYTRGGCTPLALLKLGGFHSALGANISANVFMVAKISRARTGLSLLFRRSDLFSEIPERFDVITADPPYIGSTGIETLSVKIRDHESWLALNGTAGGLAFHRRFAVKSGAHLTDGGGLHLKVDASQGTAMAAFLRMATFSDIQIIQDPVGQDRIARGVFHGRGTSQGNAALL